MQKLTNLYQTEVDQLLISVFGDRFKEYREKWYRVEAEKGHYIPEYPLHLDLEINGKCNLLCKMCSRSIYGKATINKGLSYNYITKILDESENRSYAILLGNNDEPLVDEGKCLWAIEHALKKGFIDIFLGTNGVLLNEAVLKNIIKLKVSHLTVSIDAASPEVYQKIRGKDTYLTVVNNLELFLRLRQEHRSKIPMLRVSFVEMKENHHEKDKFINFWKEKADNILIQECIDLNRSINDFNGADLAALCASKEVCYQPFRRLSISGDGEIYPCCCFISGKQSLGNIKDVTLAKAWNSDYIKWMRQMLIAKKFKEIPFCARCVVATAKK